MVIDRDSDAGAAAGSLGGLGGLDTLGGIEPNLDFLGAEPDSAEPRPAEPVYALVQHGPCPAVGVPVGERYRNYLFPQAVCADLRLRGQVGEIKYGHGLTVGWNAADTALYQEILDGCQYAVAGQRVILAHVLAWLAFWLRFSLHRAWLRGNGG